MKIMQIITTFLSLLIPSLLFTYYYPWLYNKINYFTKRGENLDDKIDFINIMLTFFITWICISVIIGSIILIIIHLNKNIINKYGTN